MLQIKNVRYLVLFICLFPLPVFAFSGDTLRLNYAQIEALFLQNNLSLAAQKLNIDKASAYALQEKYWPNPAINIQQLNPWDAKGEREAYVEFEQLIITAGKRKIRIDAALKQSQREEAIFRHLLLSLKTELRSIVSKLWYVQQLTTFQRQQLNSIQQLTALYRKQVSLGNVPQNVLIRLQAQELKIAQDVNEWELNFNELQQQLGQLLRLKPGEIVFVSDELNHIGADTLSFEGIFAAAVANNPEVAIARISHDYLRVQYNYQKRLQYPDAFLKANYDRFGPTKEHFFGIGFAVDIPLFNRNRGNIQASAIELKQAEIQTKEAEENLAIQLYTSHKNFLTALNFFKGLDPNYETALNKMLDSYHRNFQLQNISIVEYIDFLEVYLANRKSLLDAKAQLIAAANQLNYSVGTDVIQF